MVVSSADGKLYPVLPLLCLNYSPENIASHLTVSYHA
jgi:hypothetical protein